MREAEGKVGGCQQSAGRNHHHHPLSTVESSSCRSKRSPVVSRSSILVESNLYFPSFSFVVAPVEVAAPVFLQACWIPLVTTLRES